jgi:hypothetical protein
MSEWMPFDQARSFARALNLKSVNEWRQYVRGGKKPFNIPVMPNRTYKEHGWKNWGDWLGTGRLAHGSQVKGGSYVKEK